MLLPEIEHRCWRQINFRATASVLAAEFLHGLYQRHDPFLNPVRFATTIVRFFPWHSVSYAPAAEWDLLATRFGGRFLRSSKKVGQELERVLSNPRVRSLELARSLKNVKWDSLDDLQIHDLLLETHHVPLGEIYDVNLVQVEHALHCAIRQRLLETVHDSGFQGGVDVLLAELCVTSKPTCGTEVERDFLQFVIDCQERGQVDPVRLHSRLQEFVECHRSFGAAYGAQTASLEGFKHRFSEFFRLPREQLNARLAGTRAKQRSSVLRDLLADDSDLGYLVELFHRVGEVRDRNKALLGQITHYRETLLDQVATRRKIDPQSLRLYLLEEILRLLEDRLQLPEELVKRREESGLTLYRREGAIWSDGHPASVFFDLPKDRPTQLRGLCASPGTRSGILRVARSAADLTRIKIGEIIVARGTDFDLVPVLQMAGAIVTEEGGLLSHAAVLAREMSIPCIIDVPRATEILLDGCSATVEADAGLVRIARNSTSDVPGLSSNNGTFIPIDLVPLREATDPQAAGRKAATLARLASLGFPTCPDLVTIPVQICRRIGAELAVGKSPTIANVAAALNRRFSNPLLNLRSSSLGEDLVTGSAAGIYHSAIGVANEFAALIGALQTVIAAASSPTARSYYEKTRGLAAHETVHEIAILAGPYQSFAYQGSAVSRSPWAPEHVLVEYFESHGEGGCPQKGGMAIQVARNDLPSAVARSGIEHLGDDLLKVALLAVEVERALGVSIEIEWGLSNRQPTLLQARPVVRSESAHSP